LKRREEPENPNTKGASWREKRLGGGGKNLGPGRKRRQTPGLGKGTGEKRRTGFVLGGAHACKIQFNEGRKKKGGGGANGAGRKIKKKNQDPCRVIKMKTGLIDLNVGDKL